MEDKCNAGISFITHFVVHHVFLRRSQTLLTFSRYQVMYSEFCVVPSGEVTCKGYFQNKIKHYICFAFMLYFIVYNYNFYSLFLNSSTWLFYIDLEASFWCMVNPKVLILWRLRKAGWLRLFINRGNSIIAWIKQNIVVIPRFKNS